MEKTCERAIEVRIQVWSLLLRTFVSYRTHSRVFIVSSVNRSQNQSWEPHSPLRKGFPKRAIRFLCTLTLILLPLRFKFVRGVSPLLSCTPRLPSAHAHIIAPAHMVRIRVRSRIVHRCITEPPHGPRACPYRSNVKPSEDRARIRPFEQYSPLRNVFPKRAVWLICNLTFMIPHPKPNTRILSSRETVIKNYLRRRLIRPPTPLLLPPIPPLSWPVCAP